MKTQCVSPVSVFYHKTHSKHNHTKLKAKSSITEYQNHFHTCNLLLSLLHMKFFIHLFIFVILPKISRSVKDENVLTSSINHLLL